MLAHRVIPGFENELIKLFVGADARQVGEDFHSRGTFLQGLQKFPKNIFQSIATHRSGQGKQEKVDALA